MIEDNNNDTQDDKLETSDNSHNTEAQNEQVIGKVEDEKEIIVNTKSNRVPLLPSLISSIVDQIITVVISVVILFIADFIMQFAGYYIAGLLQMFLILYVICNVIYIGVFEGSKLSATPGKLLLKSKVVTK